MSTGNFPLIVSGYGLATRVVFLGGYSFQMDGINTTFRYRPNERGIGKPVRHEQALMISVPKFSVPVSVFCPSPKPTAIFVNFDEGKKPNDVGE